MEDLYKSLYQRTQELSLSGVNADAVLYDPAVPALKPAKPNKSLLLLMVVMLVVVFSIMYFIVKAAMDNSIGTLSRMKKRLNVAPLGEIRRFSGTLGRAGAGHDYEEPAECRYCARYPYPDYAG